ncbi:MAG TPA: UDP-N-acetylmuramoyl-tripeptide--D-alanyl-D-alanine ligase [Bacteroidales bacterium]|jgi:UDP-N-acetylmuramoyl-tripeptide--D-alanyl-D-alanine ligase|nr:UDP-N-acetylmuramoyl-tripeptide--D-alanyl-D-alanine ligase [Bacteroidales bacterium]
METEDLYQIFLKSKKIIIDSRNAEENSLFFALKGETFDGNAYAKSALDKGCPYAIIDKEEYVQGSNFILVENVLKSLQSLANYHRKQLNIPIVAITGTNGKTTTKELVASVLSKKFHVSFTKGNLNNHIGVPLTLLSMDNNTQLGIVEMGANHINEIKTLCEIAEPDFGIITNIGKAHLEGFGSFENIIKAKSELYEYLKAKNGKVFYNSGNSLLKRIVEGMNLDTIAFGSLNSPVYGEIISSEQYLSLKINLGDFETKINTQLIGNYNLENVLAASCIGHYYNIEPELIVSAIEEYVPTNNRSQFLKTTKNNLFLDAYNANPTSVEAAIKNFSQMPSNDKCIILGDMLELGSDSRLEHQKILDLLKENRFDQIFLIGEIYYSLENGNDILKFKNVDEFKIWLEKNNIVNSNVLIKGSRGIRLEKIVELL